MLKTFREFLTGNEAMLEKMASILARDCRQWLVDSNCVPVYRGMHADAIAAQGVEGEGVDVSENLFKQRVKKDREPLDSPKWLHDLMNKKMVADFGIPFRSQSLFAMRNEDTASNYGKVYMVYPMGRYDYAWSPIVSDATSNLYEWTDYAFVDKDATWDDLQDYAEEIPHKLVPAYRRAWQQTLMQNPSLKSSGFDDSFQSFFTAMKNDNRAMKQIVESVVSYNDLWKYNAGLMQVLTKRDFNNTEIMIAADSYYAVKLARNQERELVHKLMEKMNRADDSA
jgi:hypothetical protein